MRLQKHPLGHDRGFDTEAKHLIISTLVAPAGKLGIKSGKKPGKKARKGAGQP